MAVKAKPFLKWAGGKSRLVGTLADLLPEEIETYYEPFIGGGALFFHLAQARRFRRAVLNDFNPELTNCYEVVRDAVKDLIHQLRSLPVDRDTYHEIRALDPQSLSSVDRAARTIYLNKTGFNGLYRQNKQGAFNVSWGRYAAPKVVDAPNLEACSALLNSVDVRTGDFDAAVSDAKRGDAVYFDPPYVPLSTTSSFQSYTKEGFTLEDQARLATAFRRLSHSGVATLESNSDTATVHNLYDGFDRDVVLMRRNINCNSSSRGPVNELLIRSRRAAPVWDHRGF